MNVEDPYMKFETFSAACRRWFRAGILSRSVVLGLLTMWTLQSTGGPPYNEGRALRGSLPALSKEQKPDGRALIEPRPKVQARLAEAYGRLMSDPPAELEERNYSRALERLAERVGVPSSLIAYLVHTRLAP